MSVNEMFVYRAIPNHCYESKWTDWHCPLYENSHSTEIFSGSEAGSYSRRVDFMCHSILGLGVIKKKKKKQKKHKTPCPPVLLFRPLPSEKENLKEILPPKMADGKAKTWS